LLSQAFKAASECARRYRGLFVSAFLPEILWSLQPEATESASKSAPPRTGGGSPLDIFGPGSQSIFLLVLMFVVFYFLLIRPQQKRQKETETMLKGLRRGDKVRTTGGIRGEIIEVRDADVDILIADKVKINVTRSHVAGLDEKPSSGDKPQKT
jgi:preprotein translocase subunit YajC